jgi:hypothetical protein
MPTTDPNTPVRADAVTYDMTTSDYAGAFAGGVAFLALGTIAGSVIAEFMNKRESKGSSGGGKKKKG